ncbi:MAG: DUF805 domain-containing protein [Bacteroidaceae bacterium]|nr:DUF805 domain-containing protein [Bacteroidaceae bacterium]
MAILKCNSCGGNKMQDLGNGVYKCLYCGAIEKEDIQETPAAPQPQQIAQPIFVVQQPMYQAPIEPAHVEPAPEHGTMSFTDAIRICLTEKYACFSGRATRTEYWFYQLFFWLVSIIIYILAFSMNTDTVGIIALMFMLAFILPGLGVAVRRLHDTGRPGAWVLLGLIPFVNFVGGIILLIFYCTESEPRSNQYGNYVIMN